MNRNEFIQPGEKAIKKPLNQELADPLEKSRKNEKKFKNE